MKNFLPNVLLLGCQKAGSSTLARILETHPDILLSQGKETNIFLSSHTDSYNTRFAEVFSALQSEKYRLDASILTITSHGAIARAAIHSPPDTKVLVILRNPTDRALSSYLHLKKRGAELRSADAALGGFPRDLSQIREQEIDRVLRAVQDHKLDLFCGVDSHEGRVNAALYVSNGLYARQLSAVFAHFGKERVHVCFLDDLEKDPGSTVREVLAFLGLETQIPEEVLTIPRNPTKLPEDIPLYEEVKRSWWTAFRQSSAAPGSKPTRKRVSVSDFPAELRADLDSLYALEAGALSNLLGQELPKAWPS